MWSPGVSLESIEKQVILTAFSFYGGNKSATANSLGIAIRTLDIRLEKYEADGKAEEIKHAERRQKQHEFLQRQRGGPGYGDVKDSEAPSAPSVHGADAGVRVESAPVAPAKSSVPVSERQEVQSVLPKQASKDGIRKGR